MRRMIFSLMIACLLCVPLFIGGCEPSNTINPDVEAFVNDFLKLENYYKSRVELESWNRLSGPTVDSLDYFKGKLNYLLTDASQLEAAGRLIRVEKDPLLKEKLRYIHRMCLLATVEASSDISRLRESLAKMIASSNQDGPSADIYQDLSRLARVRNQAASRFGYNSYFDLLLYCRDVSRAEYFDLIEQVDDATGARFDQIIDSLSNLRENVKLSMVEVSLSFGKGTSQSGDASITSNYLALIKETLGGLGFNFESLPIYIAEASGKRIDNHNRLMMVDIPNDIRIVVSSTDPGFDLSDLFHLIGKAIYLVHIDQRNQYFRRSPSAGFELGMSGIIGRLVDLKDWKRKYGGLPEPKIMSQAAGKEFYKLFDLRRELIGMKFEYDLYQDPFADLKERHCQLFEEYTGLSCSVSSQDLKDGLRPVSNSLHHYDVLVGEVVASQIYHYINSKYGSVLDNVRTREFLVQNMYRLGARDDWKVMIERGTGEDVRAEYLLSAFGD